ncbi:D-amino acid dehydrogenase [Neisseriaceae bacterium TC5R-5]|nr:D-amino acid dehydrogenase [Neisseriaceae bacterium TC5R-5]
MANRVCIIGAGVVGLCTAWQLAKHGVAVTIIDRQQQVAAETSYANGGQLSYSYVAPLADAGVPLKAISWLFSKQAPMQLRLQWDVTQWQWLWQFLRVCNRGSNQVGTARLWRLAQRSRHLMDELRQQGLGEFAWVQNGKLVIYRQSAAEQAAKAGIAWLQSLGARQQWLDGDACIALEPALAPLAGQLSGGVYTADEEVADCRRFCLALQQQIIESGLDVEFCLGESVSGFEVNAGRVQAVIGTQQRHPCRQLVLAAGIGSQPLARQLGVKLPLYPLKGYSLDMPGGDSLPQISVTDADNKILYAPIAGRLRIAALADLVGENTVLDAQRLQYLQQLVQRDLPAAGIWEQAEQWTGLRPATPDGCPIIGRQAGGPDNFYVNVGQGALGFTLAMGSAEVLTQQILGPERVAA